MNRRKAEKLEKFQVFSLSLPISDRNPKNTTPSEKTGTYFSFYKREWNQQSTHLTSQEGDFYTVLYSFEIQVLLKSRIAEGDHWVCWMQSFRVSTKTNRLLALVLYDRTVNSAAPHCLYTLSQMVKISTLQRYCKGRGCKSRSGLNFFQASRVVHNWGDLAFVKMSLQQFK